MAEPLAAIELGHASAGRGNLLGIQPWLVPADFASLAAYEAKLEGYLKQASDRGWLGKKSIVIFPEYVASFLLAMDEGDRVTESGSIEMAMSWLAAKHARKLAMAVLRSKARDRIKEALFRIKGPEVARAYHEVFGRLAARHRVTLVAGSAVLPPVAITATGALEVAEGPLYNTTIVYHEDGRADRQVLTKAFPTPQELPFTACGQVDAIPVYETPAGKLGVLNCADSWYADPYHRLKALGAELIAVPSFVEKDGDMDKPWSGKNITPEPPEFDPADFRKITYDQAWIKYALPARIGISGVKLGVNVFLRGKFWNLGSDGRAIVMREGVLGRGPEGARASLINAWIP